MLTFILTSSKKWKNKKNENNEEENKNSWWVAVRKVLSVNINEEAQILFSQKNYYRIQQFIRTLNKKLAWVNIFNRAQLIISNSRSVPLSMA